MVFARIWPFRACANVFIMCIAGVDEWLMEGVGFGEVSRF